MSGRRKCHTPCQEDTNRRDESGEKATADIPSAGGCSDKSAVLGVSGTNSGSERRMYSSTSCRYFSDAWTRQEDLNRGGTKIKGESRSLTTFPTRLVCFSRLCWIKSDFCALFALLLPSGVLYFIASDSKVTQTAMQRYEQRDRSGPMDVDNHDHLDRLAQYALHDPEEGPSRKRELLEKLYWLFYTNGLRWLSRRRADLLHFQDFIVRSKPNHGHSIQVQPPLDPYISVKTPHSCSISLHPVPYRP